MWEDPTANRAHFGSLLQGNEGRFDLVLLPEMYTTGFTMDPRGKGESMTGPSVAWMKEIATQLDTVIAGSLIVEEDGEYYNRLLAVGAEGIIHQYDKRHLFRMAGEHERYQAGAEAPVLELKGWRILPLICYDLRFPVWSRNGVGRKGNRPEYDVLVYVANWPKARVEHWKLLLRARAVENHAYCLGVNRIGQDGNDYAFTGDSAVIDFMGKVLTTATDQPAMLTATLRKEPLQQYREKFPVWQDADDFSLL